MNPIAFRDRNIKRIEAEANEGNVWDNEQTIDMQSPKRRQALRQFMKLRKVISFCLRCCPQMMIAAYQMWNTSLLPLPLSKTLTHSLCFRLVRFVSVVLDLLWNFQECFNCKWKLTYMICWETTAKYKISVASQIINANYYPFFSYLFIILITDFVWLCGVRLQRLIENCLSNFILKFIVSFIWLLLIE